jgi:hypothetical protein
MESAIDSMDMDASAGTGVIHPYNPVTATAKQAIPTRIKNMPSIFIDSERNQTDVKFA